ncbi:MAG: Fur family transcriptional regulator, peroxide stress response regulator [Thermoanaerobacter sp.]|jgi:Fur family peroxide stress response transcriptional regulator|nr:MAG: ferric uptake regulator family protein [Thermoanaerobacter thermocopriae]MDK2815046.1 Fur family transcriptional regulator, peroxide stress response regulator [Thermoanaerobacter sp.]
MNRDIIKTQNIKRKILSFMKWSDIMEEAAALLKQKGLKVTPQRLAILNLLRNSKEHPTAETIYKKLASDFPTMSLATVYKTLEVLKNMGLIQELNVGEGSFRYDANTNSHPHVVCISCGKVEDLDESLLKDVLEEVSQHTDYKLVEQKLYFYGYCPACQHKLNINN